MIPTPKASEYEHYQLWLTESQARWLKEAMTAIRNGDTISTTFSQRFDEDTADELLAKMPQGIG